MLRTVLLLLFNSLHPLNLLDPNIFVNASVNIHILNVLLDVLSLVRDILFVVMPKVNSACSKSNVATALWGLLQGQLQMHLCNNNSRNTKHMNLFF